MSAGVPRHKILPVSRGWLSENILAARLGEDFSLDITFHRTGFIRADAILPKGHDRPSRWPWSRSDCRTHLRNVSPVHPTLLAIETIAAHCVLCSPWCSNTIRTARSRNSGEYFDTVFMTPSSQELESPGIPGRFNQLVGLL